MGVEVEDSSWVLQRRRQCELVLLERPCLLSLAGEVPVRLGELGPVIDPSGGSQEGEEEESWGRESSSGYKVVSFDSAGQCMLILKGKPCFPPGLRFQTKDGSCGLKGI